MSADDRLKLRRLFLRGFKSVDGQGQTLDLGDVTVLIGANGAGKSNLVSFFKMINFLTTDALQTYVADQGYADALLYYGASATPFLQARLTFENADISSSYDMTLSHAAGDILIFAEEFVTYRASGSECPLRVNLRSGHRETRLLDDAESGGNTSRMMLNLLGSCRVFHFHDTSATAKMRNHGYVGDCRYLRDNAGNLAAFLYAMAENGETKKYYDRIERRIQGVLPQFGRFMLRPAANRESIRLDWRERGRDHLFGPHALSDGSLRFMALAALLLQPVSTLPRVIVLDEPELGLHPFALSSLAGMIRAAAVHAQVVLVTQSLYLLDAFKAHEVVVVERDEHAGRTLLKRLDEAELADWLERYSLSELWEKNVLGGVP